jgi:hypothetical protein
MSDLYGFTGKDIISLTKAKGWQSVVLRLQGKWQTLEFSAQGTNGRRTVQEASIGMDAGTGDYVFMYACQGDTTWQYFVQGLKPTDRVIFLARKNGSELTKERGLTLTDVRARVARFKRDGSRLREYETTIHREIRDGAEA